MPPEPSPTSVDHVRAVAQACEQRGLRLTPLRAQTLQLVVAAGKPIKAYEVLAGMTVANGETAPMTAYRALDFLTAHGFIHRLASLSSYVVCASAVSAHAVPFLICESCHAVSEVNDQRIVAFLHGLARDQGFKPRAQSLEVLGKCAACRNG